jgi:hypothetical protein
MAGLNMLDIKPMIVMVIVGYRRFMPYSYTTCGVLKGSTNVTFQAPIHIELMKLNRLVDKIL